MSVCDGACGSCYDLRAAEKVGWWIGFEQKETEATERIILPRDECDLIDSRGESDVGRRAGVPVLLSPNAFASLFTPLASAQNDGDTLTALL